MKAKKHRHIPLIVIVTIIAFLVLVVTVIMVSVSTYLMVHLGLFQYVPSGRANFIFVIVQFSISSVIVGTMVSFVVGRISLKPVNRLITALNRLSQGDYKVRLRFGEGRVGKSLEDSFNMLAGELENTEMLRSDFVNNFSHEFKTPIVSIYGFARLLLRGNVDEKETKEYLSIIEQESGRLATMATNVLNMTKIENQSILTDVTEYNLSEQLRRSVLIMEKKWNAKNIGISCEFSEHTVSANEELLKQVWINLLDNAVKFTPQNGEITVSIYERPENILVGIKNNGPKIPEKDMIRIFNKFYQGDTSHASQGTGIGLSIVKKIVDLHKGKVWAESSDEATVFWVELPK